MLTLIPSQLSNNTFPLQINRSFDPLIKMIQKSSKKFFNTLVPSLDPRLEKNICPDPYLRPPSQSFRLEDLEASLTEQMKDAQRVFQISTSILPNFGHKHSNLIQMNKIDEMLDLKVLEIPLPQGIASNDVLALLKTKAPALFHHWQQLKELHAQYQGPSPFLDTPEAAVHLQQIGDEIERIFALPEAFAALNIPPSWLEIQEKAHNFLMVRSTGHEDSTLSNAGGNVSVAYVLPSPKPFTAAVGQVVRSYFGKASLQNRINGGTNPFAEELKLAVTAQCLIGEPIGGSNDPRRIPVSGVCFSNEPLYSGNGERIMRVSMAPGHGQAVVQGDGTIHTDTALIFPSLTHPDKLQILYDNQSKESRLVPLQREGEEEIILGKMTNLQSLINRPALSESDLAKLYHGALIMEKAFGGHPIDIEFVKQGDQFHLVQARPINRQPLLPSFLKSKEGVIASVQAEPMVPGTASLLVLQKDEILIAKTLQQAESLFSPQQHKLVVVSQEEPRNSHPTINFSALGIPCVRVPDLSALEKLFNPVHQDCSIVACIQTANLYLWDTKKGSIPIEKGFAAHPAKIAISLPVQSKPSPSRFSSAKQPLTDRLRQLREASSSQEALNVLHEISQQIQLSPKIARLRQVADTIQFLPAQAKEKLFILEALDQKIGEVMAEVEAVFKGRNHSRLEQLFYVKILETILVGSNGKGIGQFSFLDGETEIGLLDKILEYQQSLDFPAHCVDLVLAGAQAVHPEAEEAWRQFLRGLEPLLQNEKISPATWKTFNTLISALQKTEALSSWITFLPKSIDATLLDEVTKGLAPSDLSLMGELVVAQDQLAQINDSIERLSDPTSHTEAWKEVTSLIESYSSEEALQKIRNASSPVRWMAYKIMQKMIDTVDMSLKTFKMSSQFDPSLKGPLFKQMLYPYFKMMKQWAGLPSFQGWQSHPDWPLSGYLRRVEEILDALDAQSPAALLPSRDFSVSAALFTASTAFERHRPNTLEDLFTLCHQNLNSFLSILSQGLVSSSHIQESMLPRALKQAIHEIDTTNFGVTLQKSGFQIDPNKISVNYNIPLRNHSGHIDLVWDFDSFKFLMRGQLLGEARRRWQEASVWAAMLQESGIFPPAEPLFQNLQELTFKWNLSSELFPHAMKEYAAMAEYSLGSQNYEGAIEQFFHRWENTLHIDRLSRSVPPIQIDAFSPFYYHSDLHQPISIDPWDQQEVEKRITALCLGKERALKDQWMTFLKNHSASSETLQHPVLRKLGQSIDKRELTLMTSKALMKHDFSDIANGLELFHSLELFQGLLKEEMSFLEKVISSNCYEDRKHVFSLLNRLVKQGQAYQEATHIANKMFNELIQSEIYSNDDVYATFNLLETLIYQDQAYEPATRIAKEASKHQNFYIKWWGIRLLRALVDQGQAYKEAAHIAETLFNEFLHNEIHEEDYMINTVVFNILEALVDQGEAYEVAARVAKIASGHEDLLYIYARNIKKLMALDNLNNRFS